jgi:transposase
MPSKQKHYNQRLIERGSITFWIDESVKNSWYQSSDHGLKKGRPFKYSDEAIICMLMIRYVYRLPLRQTQGFVASIVQLFGWSLGVVSYTQLCRRQKTVKMPKLPKKNKPIVIAIDGTGLKMYGEGEWKVRQHGWVKRRDWRKFHVGIDVDTGEIVTQKLTDNHVAENHQLNDLLEGYGEDVEAVLADAGYDQHGSYEVIDSYGAKPIIAPNINPKHPKKRWDKLRRGKVRDAIRWMQEQMGVKPWKIAIGYHKRSLVENTFYRFKYILGDRLASRLMTTQQAEVAIKSHILNKMIAQTF